MKVEVEGSEDCLDGVYPRCYFPRFNPLQGSYVEVANTHQFLLRQPLRFPQFDNLLAQIRLLHNVFEIHAIVLINLSWVDGDRSDLTRHSHDMPLRKRNLRENASPCTGGAKG